MRKSVWMIITSTLALCSSAFSQLPYPIENQLHLWFQPYRQIEISPLIQPLVESKIRNSTYSVQYDRKTAAKNVSLDNALLEVKVYYNGNPRGVMTVATDQQQHFLFGDLDDKSLVVFELLSINGQASSTSKCYGTSFPGHPDIVIYCK